METLSLSLCPSLALHDLTPIKVRGRRKKRPAPDNNDDDNTNNNNNGAGADIRPKRKGRPLLPPKSLLSSSLMRTSKRIRLLTQMPKSTEQEPSKRKQTLSILESLPVELLEKIFFYSLNVNLPRASPSLAAAVSSERVYRVLILLAFWDDDGHDNDYLSMENGNGNGNGNIMGGGGIESDETILRILRPLESDYTPLGSEERRILQSTILRCRWCTVGRIQRQFPDLLRLIVWRRWSNAGFVMEGGQREELERFLHRLSGQQDRDQEQEQEHCVFNGTKQIQNQNQERVEYGYTLSINPSESVTISCTNNNNNTNTKKYPILNIKSIPEHLLRGKEDQGFTSSQITFLETLRVAGGFNTTTLLQEPEARNISISRDALQQGIHNALITTNTRALKILLQLDEYFFRSQHHTAAATEGEAGIRNNENKPLYTIPPEHFRTAVQMRKYNNNNNNDNDKTILSLFHLLLRASAESVPPDDSDITQFAMDIGGVFGTWLLDLMMELPGQVERARERPREGSLFYLGRPNWGVEMARRYVEEVLGGVYGDRDGL